jgi:hypothetical protein
MTKPMASEQPERISVLIAGNNHLSAYALDPRQVHNSGKPVYEYITITRYNEVCEAAEKAADLLWRDGWRDQAIELRAALGKV